MGDTQVLLDSPKRALVQQHSTELRGILKDFERQFTDENGRKPQQKDIKLNAHIAAKYKEYHKTQDVLSGILSLEKYASTKTDPKAKSRRHTRKDSGLGSSPRLQARTIQSTPKKQKHPYERGSPDFGDFIPSNLPLTDTVGPTPHRDGKVLGLFDLISTSESNKSQSATPTASARKRKMEELYEETPAKRPPLQVIQTPSQRSARRQGDLLDFLTGTPQKSWDLGNAKHSRTPQSEGRKFELNRFFATPSARRFLFADLGNTAEEQAQTRDRVISRTPQKQPDSAGLDTTPTYLRRSTSFKDRLLSATQTSTSKEDGVLVKPRMMQHFRSSTANTLKANDRLPPKSAGEVDGYEDDMEALREFEDEGYHDDLLAEDSQMNRAPTLTTGGDEQEPTRQYKKKGQKRTTRKSNIKPVTYKSTAQPHFVAADGHESGSDAQYSDDDEEPPMVVLAKDGVTAKVKEKKKGGTINPNAQSHMNYRSLKIKNKNSKAKGTSARRFGRGRR